MTTKHTVIRVEGVNQAAVLDDTSDLSVRRGAGFNLLKAAIETKSWAGSNATVQSTGASAAILSVDTPEIAKQALIAIRQKLIDSPYKHFTFVTTAATGETFASAEKAALAAARWQQQQSLSIALPKLNEVAAEKNAVCEIDHVRPNTPGKNRTKNRTSPSESVRVRRALGRRLRQSIYEEITEQGKWTQQFTNDLHSLAAPLTSDTGIGNMRDKIAVIYADGNSFGAIGRAAAQIGALSDWDREIKYKRRKLLNSLLDAVKADARMIGIDGRLRFETLLWGGDEFIFVVPAWCGFAVWRHLHEQTKDWHYEVGETEHHLTHAFSLVFAHSKAPIQRLVKLAKDLAEKGKDEKSRTESTLTWTSLESFDHLGLDLDSGLKRRYHDTVGWRDWSLNAAQAIALDDFLGERAKLPHRQIVAGAIAQMQLRRISQVEVGGSTAHPDPTEISKLDSRKAEIRKRCELASAEVFAPDIEGVETIKKNFEALLASKNSADNPAAAWAQLAEAWDYAGQPKLGAKSDATELTK